MVNFIDLTDKTYTNGEAYNGAESSIALVGGVTQSNVVKPNLATPNGSQFVDVRAGRNMQHTFSLLGFASPGPHVVLNVPAGGAEIYGWNMGAARTGLSASSLNASMDVNGAACIGWYGLLDQSFTQHVISPEPLFFANGSTQVLITNSSSPAHSIVFTLYYKAL